MEHLQQQQQQPHQQQQPPQQQQQQHNNHSTHSRQRYPSPRRQDLQQKCNRGSYCSDTSSAYSGSDTMASVHSSTIDADEIDLSGLVESVVDSDEEDLAESMDSLNVRDVVRDCLEKDPSERTEEDIDTLVEFTQGLKAFTNITLAVRRALCSVMVFAVVDKAGTVVMSDGEELDSWSVLINGHVEIEHANGSKEEVQMGDSFGILPTMDKLYHRGVMRTKCDDCQFVCITQTDYYRIQHQGEENTRRHEDCDGRLVMVTELRQLTSNTSGAAAAHRRGHVVIRGTVERLLLHLVEENSMTDPTYVEDFLLTHRVFIRNPQEVTQKLLEWFESEAQPPTCSPASPQEIRDRVTRVVLLWVNNHFTDFETDDDMLEFLDVFESGLQRNKQLGQLRLLHIACAAKARMRTITLTRSSRDESLNFRIVGGYEMRGATPTGSGIFIAHVERDSKAHDVGLKRGDQILEVNGQSFEHVTNKRALELLTSSTHLSITVRSNLLAFKSSTTDQVDCCPSPQSPVICTAPSVGFISSMRLHPAGNNGVGPSSARKESSATSAEQHMGGVVQNKGGGFMTLGPKRRIQKALMKMKNLGSAVAQTNSNAGLQQSSDDGILLDAHTDATDTQKVTVTKLYQSQSNPDLSTSCYEESSTVPTPYHATARSSNAMLQDYPEHVLKVYRADQTCKYLLINKETTAHEVVMLALHEFGVHDPSSNFSLCEVSVGEGGLVKQRRLPDQLQNLAERIGLSARYYLKTIGSTENLVPDELAVELLRESTVHFLHLNAYELAVQLTLQDFAIFRQIESTEYVDDLFELKSKYGVPMLSNFAELVNREMFWVVSEVCSEHNIVRRMKIVKQFVKIARYCKECRNFNSMFAIISGLGHAAVSRLRQTWEKLPSKYQRLFADLQDLMDPSRNMSKYRQLVAAEYLSQLPIIPFYPVVKKDLTFIHLGNDTRVEQLINFEKLRMIAKEVRMLTHMCASSYDMQAMLELKTHNQISALSALNQMTTSGTQIAANAGQSTVKRRKKSTMAPNPKKMFEEAQMVRRVKSYLQNMRIINDEDTLHKLSVECEPPQTSRSGDQLSIYSHTSSSSAPNSSLSLRKRQPSPTRSTTSSTSSTSGEQNRRNNNSGPKFGTASPQAVKKILSLAETTKVRSYQPRHAGIALPLVGNPHHVFSTHALGVPVPASGTSASANPSPNSHRRLDQIPAGYTVRNIHERSHSDTLTPLPSVDLSVESSSVTSFSNLPLRKNTISGSLTSNDSGHGSSYTAPPPPPPHDMNSVIASTNDGALFHLVPSHHHLAGRNASAKFYNASPAAPSNFSAAMPSPTAQWCTMTSAYHGGNSAPPTVSSPPPPPPPRPPSRGPRHPPAYSVAAHMAHMQRLGRAHSMEGVLAPSFYHSKSVNDVDDDEEAQVSAV